MTGLLGNGWEDPRSSAVMALAGGLLQGNFGGGLLGASNAFAEAKNSAAKKQFMDMQMQNLQSEIEARKLKGLQLQQKQDTINSVFGPLGIGAPQVSPGAFLPSPSAAGPMGPVMPQSMGAMAVPGSRLANLNFDELARLKLADMDLTDLHKYANDPRKLEGGSTYENRVTGQREFMPKLPEGMALNNGRASFVPGFQESIVGLKGAEARATAGAQADFDTIEVYNPVTQRKEFRPRSQVVNAAQPPVRPASASEAALRPLVQGDMGANPASIQREIAQTRASLPFVKDQASRQQLEGYIADLERQASALPGAMAAGPSGPEVAATEAARTRAVEQAKADVMPTAQREQAQLSADYLLNTIGKALVHPGRETATGLSGTLDPRNMIPGTKAKDFRVLMDQIQGSAFLKAFESLKGGGAITQVEGEKAERAIARLNTAQSDGEFASALKEFQSVVKAGSDRLKAGGAPAPLPANPTPQTLTKGKAYTLPGGKVGTWDGMGFKVQ